MLKKSSLLKKIVYIFLLGGCQSLGSCDDISSTSSFESTSQTSIDPPGAPLDSIDAGLPFPD